MIDKNKVVIPERFKDHPIFNELLCGTNFGFMAKRGYYTTETAKQQPEIMRKTGINWTTLNMNFCQSKYYSDKVYLDFEYSTGELELADMVKRLHDNGIKVLFKPCLTSLDGAWMGCVKFPTKDSLSQIQGVDNDYWGKWSKSFIEAEKYFAEFAERVGIDSMIIGAEYLGTEGQNEMWEKVIEEVRKRYSGPITYEFTCDSRKQYDLNWFKDLDFLSYSYYPPAIPFTSDMISSIEAIRATPDYTVEDMAEHLAKRKPRIQSISERFGNKPIAFTEYGVRSAHGCIMRPYDFLWDTPYDGKQQADFMEASFRTFWELPQWMGFFWWKWDETQNRPQYKGDPNGDRGFTIQGKPAEDVMRRWIAKNK